MGHVAERSPNAKIPNATFLSNYVSVRSNRCVRNAVRSNRRVRNARSKRTLGGAPRCHAPKDCFVTTSSMLPCSQRMFLLRIRSDRIASVRIASVRNATFWTTKMTLQPSSPNATPKAIGTQNALPNARSAATRPTTHQASFKQVKHH